MEIVDTVINYLTFLKQHLSLLWNTGNVMDPPTLSNNDHKVRDDVSDSTEDESFDEAYERHVEWKKEKEEGKNVEKTYYNIKIFGNPGQVTIGSTTSQHDGGEGDLIKFALVSYNQIMEKEEDNKNTFIRANKCPNFQQEDDAYFKRLVESHKHAYKSKPMGEDLMQNMVSVLLLNQPLTVSNSQKGYKLTAERMVEVSKSVDEFRNLTKEEKSVLLAENTDMLVSLRGVIFFCTNHSGMDQLKLTSGYDDEQSLDKLIGVLRKKDTDHLNTGGAIVYKQFNRLQAPLTCSLEEKYENLQENIGKMVKDDVISALLTIIILFMSDFHKEKCIMYKYIRILARYITTKTSFTMDMVNENISYLKSLQNLKKRRRRLA